LSGSSRKQKIGLAGASADKKEGWIPPRATQKKEEFDG